MWLVATAVLVVVVVGGGDGGGGNMRICVAVAAVLHLSKLVERHLRNSLFI